ncbi:uncharacterized protein LOC113859367 [Abrus precatorius]|uniref:Uncharacterized protein LOC113859367 n=1 Tax=Abrus precatorius TaxID=3816 RepID=A0A8B8L007_ABRPR|nr:uncharacterized protein LOC113859367 [Abrus precatorius]
MTPFEALYGRRCRTLLCWYETGEVTLCVSDMIQRQNEQIRMIRDKMKAAQDRQKSYYNRRRKPLEFQLGDHVFLKVSPITRVGRALKSQKLSPKFIGLFEVLSRIGPATYRIVLPPNLSNLHLVFHVSQLRQYVSDPSHVIDLDPVQVREDLSYDVYPVRIADHCVKQLRDKDISLVKVIWSLSDEGDVTWETKSRMRELYPEVVFVVCCNLCREHIRGRIRVWVFKFKVKGTLPISNVL